MVHRFVTLSDFNVSNFHAVMDNSDTEPKVQSVETPFGQIHQLLLNDRADCWREDLDFGIVWTQPQSVLPMFARALEGDLPNADQILQDVDTFCQCIVRFRERVKTVFVPTWSFQNRWVRRSVFDLATTRGLTQLIWRMNLRMVDQLLEEPGIYTVDSSHWVQSDQGSAETKLWYMSRTPFAIGAFKKACSDIKSALIALKGGARKLLLADLDNTLWGGVVGDVGWEGLVLGGHDPAGEAFCEFQRGLRRLRSHGVLLGIVSKNEESVALNAIERHPEMILTLDDFAGWRINWNDKAQNVIDLVNELGLGLQSTVFIDDNPVERARVAESIRDVFVPDWPRDPILYPYTLTQLKCFDTPYVSDEDLRRTEMYRVDRERSKSQQLASSLEEWVDTLETQVRIIPLNSANLDRAVQLLNKTNQMNLATRRMHVADFQRWADTPGCNVYTVHVCDRFGDQGLVGLLSLQKSQRRLAIVDFLLSCRVMGRMIEESMLFVAIQRATISGLAGVDALFHATEKNQPCLTFFQQSGWRQDDSCEFHWECSRPYDAPSQLEIDLRLE